MTLTCRIAAALALLVSTACAPDSATNEGGDRDGPATSAGNQELNMAAETTSADPAGSQPASATGGSILAWSRPDGGATITAAVNELVFHFSPAASLGEVTITGPDGTMPIMVNAIGEIEHYSLPISADQPGSYTVTWRATAGGREYRDRFDFTVR